MRTFPLSLLLAGLMAGASVAPAAAQSTTDGRVGPSLAITGNGRALTPAGRLTVLGDFPSGGALSPDGRFYWAIDSGLGHNDAKIVDVASGSVVQSLPLPGTYGAVAFAPDGRAAYVSGEPKGDVPAEGQTRGDAGDVVHVFAVDPRTGRASEQDPIVLPRPDIKELNTPASPDAKLSQKLPFDRLDLVPQAILDRILWHSVHGADSTPPPPGPNASILEHERALGALAVLRHGGDVRRWLDAAGGAGDDEGEQPGGWGAIARGAIHAGSPPGVGSGP